MQAGGDRPASVVSPSVSGDTIMTNDIAYPGHNSARGVREGHGYVYVDARNKEFSLGPLLPRAASLSRRGMTL